MEDKYIKRRFDSETEEVIDTGVLETVNFSYPQRKTEVEIIHPEFTSVCPWTGLPDFGVLTIKYVPRKKLVELKSLKYYLHSFRNVGILQEHVVNRVLEDLVRLLDPRSIIVIAEFYPRGGIKTVVKAEYPENEG